MTTEAATLLIDTPTDGVRIIRLNRPEKRNALERFSADLNRQGFPGGGFSDSGSVPVKEAGMDGPSLIA